MTAILTKKSHRYNGGYENNAQNEKEGWENVLDVGLGSAVKGGKVKSLEEVENC